MLRWRIAILISAAIAISSSDVHLDRPVDTRQQFRYQAIMERQFRAQEAARGYFTAPWRKARICARFVLHPELTQRQRYARIAAALAKDPSVTNRLVAQAIAHLQGKAHQRCLET